MASAEEDLTRGRQSRVLLPIVVITAAPSRFMLVQTTPTVAHGRIAGGMWMQLLGWVPRRLIWDNDSGDGCANVTPTGLGLGRHAGTTLQRLKPYDFESKGIMERRRGFFETSFMPAGVFASVVDFNMQFN